MSVRQQRYLISRAARDVTRLDWASLQAFAARWHGEWVERFEGRLAMAASTAMCVTASVWSEVHRSLSGETVADPAPMTMEMAEMVKRIGDDLSAQLEREWPDIGLHVACVAVLVLSWSSDWFAGERGLA